MQQARDNSTPVNQFSIKSGNNEFQTRQASVFDQLTALETKHENSIAEWVETEVVDDEDESKTIPSPSESEVQIAVKSQFKVPVGPAIKRSKADYQVHPEKWTKYSLADVDDDDLSEASNSQAASDFLRSRWANRDTDYEKTEESDVAYGHFRMPEYVVGKPKINKRKREESSSQKVEVITTTKGSLSFDEKQFDGANEAAKPVENSTDSSAGDTAFRTVKKRQRNIRKIEENAESDNKTGE